jgi:CBS domain-containing protein
MMMIRDVMSVPAETCHPETGVAAVAKLMWGHDCGFVPVVGATGAVVGVITDRDICIATATRRSLREHVSAAQAMTSPIHACLPTDQISDALATMKQFRIRRLPVLDAEGHLQGVISMNDIVLVSERKGQPAAKDIVSTLAAICTHRSVEPAVV